MKYNLFAIYYFNISTNDIGDNGVKYICNGIS